MTAMRYLTLGRSGLRVSEIALGTMTFSAAGHRGDAARPSPGASWAWCASEADARTIFERYLAAGGNVVDTADVYAAGSSEPLVGELVRPVRDHVVLASKFGLSRSDGRVDASGSGVRSMTIAVEGSLRRLGTDRLDLLWLHAWDGITPAEEIALGFDTLLRSGKVLHWGVSDSPAWFVAALVQRSRDLGLAPPVAVQLRYSVLDRSAELDLLPMSRWFDLGVAAFGVLGGGALSGKYTAAPSGTGRRGDGAALRDDERRVACGVDAVAAAVGATAAQVALAWARSRRVVCIVGARTPLQLDDTLGALELQLGDEHLAALDALAPPPRLFPHDVLATVADQLRGGSVHDRFDVPPWAAF
jgi:aryl-alcohol dehydrogenase-like predicted oxidoreductase